MKLDQNIVELVEALNSLPHVRTIGSCGGHPEPLQTGQWPEGEWYVNLRV